LKIAHSSEASEKFFRSVLPSDSKIKIRPMFGNLSGFVNGNMFTGVYGEDVFVRLSEKNREDLLKIKGTSLFEPMKGRKMKDYVVFPKGWREKPEMIRTWIVKSLDDISKLPPKK
jgi:TfoX/Sxy family transcriptional regulator of competence genes